jgi:hypothetical protein
MLPIDLGLDQENPGVSADDDNQDRTVRRFDIVQTQEARPQIPQRRADLLFDLRLSARPAFVISMTVKQVGDETNTQHEDECATSEADEWWTGTGNPHSTDDQDHERSGARDASAVHSTEDCTKRPKARGPSSPERASLHRPS